MVGAHDLDAELDAASDLGLAGASLWRRGCSPIAAAALASPARPGPRARAGTTTHYRCTIHDDRPRTCSDFTLGSAHCLTARRRAGLSL